MNPSEALSVMDQIIESVPMVDSDDAIISDAMRKIGSVINDESTELVSYEDLQTSLQNIFHIVKAVPLRRAERQVKNQAVYVLSQFVNSLNLSPAEDQPAEAVVEQPVKKARRKKVRA